MPSFECVRTQVYRVNLCWACLNGTSTNMQKKKKIPLQSASNIFWESRIHLLSLRSYLVTYVNTKINTKDKGRIKC